MSVAERLESIDIMCNYIFKTKIGRKCAFDTGVWVSKELIINNGISFKSCYLAQRTGILDLEAC